MVQILLDLHDAKDNTPLHPEEKGLLEHNYYQQITSIYNARIQSVCNAKSAWLVCIISYSIVVCYIKCKGPHASQSIQLHHASNHTLHE